MSGIEIPGYEILERIGAGGMATVWKARQLSLDRTVAIKILYSRFAVEPSDVNRFRGEAQLAARLKHPGIVQVHDASVHNNLYYIVMEYVAGYSVGDWIRRRGPLPETESLVVAECVVDALQHALATTGLIHCDIKPENILIDSDGTVKVTDLGLARTMSSLATGVGGDEIMGTPQYMSPEQVEGRADLDFHTDVYALGATLYHMLSGQVPFHGHAPEAVMDLQVSGSLPDLIDVNPSVSPAVCWLVEKMLSKDPALRQRSWKEVRLELQRVKRRQRPYTRLTSGASTMQRSPRRAATHGPRAPGAPDGPAGRPAALGAVAAATALLAATVGVVMVGRCARDREAAGGREQAPAAGAPAGISREREESARRAFESAMAWAAMNPGQLDAIVERYSSVSMVSSGTVYSSRAQVELGLAQRNRLEAIRAVMQKLEGESAAAVREGRFEDAARMYESYGGPQAELTRNPRIEAAAVLRERAAAEARAREQAKGQGGGAGDPKTAEAALDRVADCVIAGDLQGASATLVRRMWNNADEAAPDREAIKAAHEFLQRVAAMDQRMVAPFQAKVGEPVSVRLKTGVLKGTLQEISGTVLVLQPEGTNFNAYIRAAVDDWSCAERLERIASDSSPEAAFARGLLALEAGSPTYAKRFLESCGDPLAERVLRRMK